jgi:signal transduction histidine kinase
MEQEFTEVSMHDISMVAQISAVPSMLEMVCKESGMGFSAIARVTESSWTACAVRDNINLGIQPGERMSLETTTCQKSRTRRTPIVDFHADFPTTQARRSDQRKLSVFVSVPIVLCDGEHFGSICVMDTTATRVCESRLIPLLKLFSTMISAHLDAGRAGRYTEGLLKAEREWAILREESIAVLGHDLRTPLAAISSSIDYLKLQLDSSETAVACNLMRSSVKRMTKLVDDLLDFAHDRMGAGIPTQIRSVDNLSEHLQDVIAEVSRAHAHRTITAHFNIVHMIECDPARMQQLLANLLANAVAYGECSHAVHVSAVTDDFFLTLEVTNHGEPIPAESIPKLFQPYWRGCRSSNNEGLGLGLYICQQIVVAHFGTIEVSSSKESGTRFVAQIPFSVPKRQWAETTRRSA